MVLVLALVGAAIPASAHVNGAENVSWDLDGPGDDLWNIDQVIWVDDQAPSTYWALYFQFAESADGGYIGLQTNGNRFDGSTGDTAIFSLWNANGARGGDGTCDTFDGEGVGYSCRRAWTLRDGVQYRLRIWRLEKEGDNQWWGGWIHSAATGRDYHLGDIRVPASDHFTFGSPVNFVEYFGEDRPCDDVPVSTASFTQPAGNYLGSTYQYNSSYRQGSFTRLACTGGGVTEKSWGWTDGVELALGGPR